MDHNLYDSDWVDHPDSFFHPPGGSGRVSTFSPFFCANCANTACLSFHRKSLFMCNIRALLLSTLLIYPTLSSRLKSQVCLQRSLHSIVRPNIHPIFLRVALPGKPRSWIPSTGPGAGDLTVNRLWCPLRPHFYSSRVSSPAHRMASCASQLPSIRSSAVHVFRATRAGHSGARYLTLSLSRRTHRLPRNPAGLSSEG